MATTNDTITENGAPAFVSTLDPRLNLFFKTVRDLGNFEAAVPAHLSRPQPIPVNRAPKQPRVETSDSKGTNDDLYNLVNSAWDVDKLDTLKILMNWRDCRGGKGDYSGFLVALAHLYKHTPKWVEINLTVIPEYGCWLDLVKLWHLSPEAKQGIMTLISNKLLTDRALLNHANGEGVSLLAKWIPSENSRWDRYSRDRFCMALCRSLFNLKEKDQVTGDHLKKLRQEYLVPLREHLDLVERKMCKNQYDDIDYEKVPSVAMKKYKDAFARHSERFKEFMAKVESGKATIKSSQVYPHDLVRQYLTNCVTDPVVEAQWKEIKKTVHETGAFDRSIAVVDVSGSMSGTPMEVAIALGLLSVGPWNNNKVISFSEHPILHHIPEGSLREQVSKIDDMPVGLNTDFEKVMDLVLKLVVEGAPIDKLFVFSDMQFDEAMRNGDVTHFQRAKKMFADVDAAFPTIVFWNLRGNTSNFPVTCDENGVVLLAGYSPSLLKSIIEQDELTPLSIMFKIIHGPRYNAVMAPIES
jgi:hypothetical protein